MRLTKIFLVFFLGLPTLKSYALGQVENVEGDTAADLRPDLNEWNIRRHAEVESDQGAPVEQRLRDPFSPVGYTPPPATTGGSGTIGVSTTEAASRGPVDFHGLTTEEQAIIMQHLDVDGFLKQNDIYIAIINNQVLSPGDNLNITARGREYRFLVKKITPDNVVLHAAK